MKYAQSVVSVLTVSLQTLEHIYMLMPIYLLFFYYGHVCRLALYDIRSSHTVKETSACVYHLHKGKSKYADTFTTVQADLSLSE